MSVRFLTTTVICLTLLCILGSTYAEVYVPRSHDEALDLMNDFKRNLTVMVFVDPEILNAKLEGQSSKDKNETSGFFASLFNSVAGIFTSKEQSVSDLIYELGQKNIVIEVNATDSKFSRLQDMYSVPSIPYIILFKGNKIMYRDVATCEAGDKIKSIITAYKEEKLEQERAEELFKNATAPVVIEEIVTIAPGKASFKPTSSDNPFVFNTTNTDTKVVEYTEKIIEPVVVTTVTTEYPVYSSSSTYPKYSSPVVASGSTKNATVTGNGFIPGVIASDRYVRSQYKPVVSNSTNKYVSTPFGYKANEQQFDRIDQRWKQILDEESKMVDEIKKIYDDDAKLSETLKESEEEIHESEELFYKAKNAIDKTLQESEKQMLQYEQELDRLYKARQSAIRAKDDLYHPYAYGTVPTREGYIQQRVNAPYTVIKRPGGPVPENYNFHSMYDNLQPGNKTSDGRQ